MNPDATNNADKATPITNGIQTNDSVSSKLSDPTTAQNIMFVSAEVQPYSQVGGLGTVMDAQPKALAQQGKDVSVISPWYGFIKNQHDDIEEIGSATVRFNDKDETITIGKKTDENGVTQIFVGHPYFEEESGKVYTTSAAKCSNEERFAFFSKASLAAAQIANIKPDIIQANDWHTAYIPALLKHGKKEDLPNNFKAEIPTVLTIHNAGARCYQGAQDLDTAIKQLGLPSKTPHLEYGGQANAMWAGVGNADQVIAVSPNYAKELTDESQYGSESLPLHKFNDGTFAKDKIVGITNGIDLDDYAPGTNQDLPQQYDKDDFSGKELSKAALCDRFNFNPQRPILVSLGRIANQKGADTFVESTEKLIEQGWNILICGQADESSQDIRATIHRKIADNIDERKERTVEPDSNFDISQQNIAFYDAFAKGELKSLAFAGADAIIIPSRFEPCGLTQMEAMRYGTLPIATDTGGLHDTVKDGETGFLFPAPPTANGIVDACSNAIEAYQDPEKWQSMIKDAMEKDNSWKHAAEEYTQVYDKLVNERERERSRELS